MLFAKKTKGYCIDIGGESILWARLSGMDLPLIVEELREFSVGDDEGIKQYLKTAEGKGPTGYAHARCGVSPPRSVVRRQTLDLKRTKEPAYFSEIFTQQFRIEAEKYSMFTLNASDGSEYDSVKGTQKEVLFCGMPHDEIVARQDALLATGIYPENLELTSVAMLGGLVNYLKFKQSNTPLLFLEMGYDSTQSHILSSSGVDISRPISSGISSMIPVVQKELGLKDEESARKLFYSNTFDFTSMGGVLVKKLLKELQASIGFYEVQTGQSVGNVLCLHLPPNLDWLRATLAGSLGIGVFELELPPWLESLGIRFAEGVSIPANQVRWLGLFSLLASYHHVPTDQKK